MALIRHKTHDHDELKGTGGTPPCSSAEKTQSLSFAATEPALGILLAEGFGKRSEAAADRGEYRQTAGPTAPGVMKMIWVWTVQTLLIATAFHLARAQGQPPSRREMWEVVIANGASGVIAALHG